MSHHVVVLYTYMPDKLLTGVLPASLGVAVGGAVWAWLYDQAKGGREKKLNTSALNEFTIYDKDENPMIEAKVVKIEEEFMIILSEGKYYRLGIGDFLYPAIRNPLSKSELKELGITPDDSEKDKPKKEKDEEE